eukprot:m.56857 g.56857  ORF g.56857 m.56857 type:complete len:326 (+) comp11204_c0_seq1:29-1006(+)
MKMSALFGWVESATRSLLAGKVVDVVGMFATGENLRRVAYLCGGVAATFAASVLSYHVVVSFKYYNQPWFSFTPSPALKNTAFYSFEDERFFDLSSTAWVPEFEDKWKIIEAELHRFLDEKPVDFQPYFRPDLVNRSGAWKTLGLKAWGLQDDKMLSFFPETCKLLDAIPDKVVSVSFNHLEANGVVKGHQGNTNGISRFHLGLKVPADASKCFFKVSSDTHPWEEGKLFAFCDAHWHTAQNLTDESRYIILFDVIRPQYAHMWDYICARVVADLALQYFSGRSSIAKLFLMICPMVTRFVMYHSFVPIFHIMVRVNPNILGFFS